MMGVFDFAMSGAAAPADRDVLKGPKQRWTSKHNRRTILPIEPPTQGDRANP
jgi:hypothetical protein